MDQSPSKYQRTAQRMDQALLELLERKDLEYITVKELCQTAGVHRSTFYLHYETVGDLLDECTAYVQEQCAQRFTPAHKDLVAHRLATAELGELNFITPEFLTPYFQFVRDNRRLFRVALDKPASLRAEGTFAAMFENVFSPILSRFALPQEDQPYIIAFYIAGLMAIVSQWLKSDCADPIERVVRLCMDCVLPRSGGLTL